MDKTKLSGTKLTHIASTFYFLQTHKVNAEKNKKSLQSSAQEKFLPTLLFLIKLFCQRTGIVRNRTDIASNVNRFEQSVCELQTTHLRTDSRAAANIKIKRNKFFWGFVRNLKVSASNKQLWLMKVYRYLSPK